MNAQLEPHSKRTIDRAVNALDDNDYASLGREVRRLQAGHDRLREALERIAAGQNHSNWPDYAQAILAIEAAS